MEENFHEMLIRLNDEKKVHTDSELDAEEEEEEEEEYKIEIIESDGEMEWTGLNENESIEII